MTLLYLYCPGALLGSLWPVEVVKGLSPTHHRISCALQAFAQKPVLLKVPGSLLPAVFAVCGSPGSSTRAYPVLTRCF